MVFEAPALLTLVRVNASQAAPARDLRFSGLGFRDSAASFMEPHSVPSGGDWALERVAALEFEGVERLVVDNCTISRAGGNGPPSGVGAPPGGVGRAPCSVMATADRSRHVGEP
jgi:hypothetical protein